RNIRHWQESRNRWEAPGMPTSGEDPGQAKAVNSLQRRKFTQLLLGSGFLATAVAFLYPLLRYLVPPKALDLGGDSVVAAKTGEPNPNTRKFFVLGTRPGLLLRTRGAKYRPMPPPCPPLSCPFQSRDDLQRVWCPCHNGQYDLNGRNISGPPPRPLELFE